MNILMINPVHPSVPHISGVRAWRFSQELAKRGHRVVLLTARHEGQTGDDTSIVDTGDWREPVVLACGAAAREESAVQPMKGLPGRLATAMRMLRHGGRGGAWVQEAVRTALRSRSAFEPNVVWCTFGMLESVFAVVVFVGWTLAATFRP